jgi:hypothetical protein
VAEPIWVARKRAEPWAKVKSTGLKRDCGGTVVPDQAPEDTDDASRGVAKLFE